MSTKIDNIELRVVLVGSKDASFFSGLSDDVKNKLYTEEQIREILLIFRNYNLLSMKYETREQVLYTLMNISYEYGIKDDELINNINSIRNGLEDDLNEYIDEIKIPR